MQKKLFVHFCFTLLCITGMAQKSKGIFAELQIGPSFPGGQFANSSFSNGTPYGNTSGLAQTGLSANIMLGFPINQSIGAVLLFGANFNKQDPSAFDAYLKQMYGSNINTTINTKDWNILKLMAGGYYKLPISAGKFGFRFKALAGACKTDIPGYSFYAVEGNTSFPTLAVSASSADISLPWSFAYQLGGGINYKINKSIRLLLDIDYFNSSPKQAYAYLTSSTPPYYTNITQQYSLSSINSVVGVEIKF